MLTILPVSPNCRPTVAHSNKLETPDSLVVVMHHRVRIVVTRVTQRYAGSAERPVVKHNGTPNNLVVLISFICGSMV